MAFVAHDAMVSAQPVSAADHLNLAMIEALMRGRRGGECSYSRQCQKS